MALEEKAGFCTLCRSRCGTINIVENGRLLAVKPAPDHPTGKALCPKGRAAPEIAHSARRITRPLRRTRAKDSDDPGFVEISWDEALSEIAERLGNYRNESGAESVAFALTSVSSTSISDSFDWVQRFIRLFGSPNTATATEICNWHKDSAHAFTFGCALPAPDYRNADLIVLWGHNPANSWLAQAESIAQARARGARLVSIDPRKSGSSKDADLWLRVRPGTDGALALGVARHLIRTGLFNQAFVRRWTNGPFLVRRDNGKFLRGADVERVDAPEAFMVWDTALGRAVPAEAVCDPAASALDGEYGIQSREGDIVCRPAFAEYAEACEPYTAEHVEKVTWVPVADFKTFCDEVARSARICYFGWSGVGQHTNATQTTRAVAVLYALTGCFDAPGGNVRFAHQPVNSINARSLLSPAQQAKAIGLDFRPLGPPADGWIMSDDLYTAILERRPYPVRALVAFGANLVVSHVDPDRARAALKAVDFFVHCDLFLNPTAELADIVLPVNSPWEREALRFGFEISHEAQELVQLRQQIIPAVGESRSDMWIVFELATRLGMGAQFFGGDIESGWNYELAPLGLTVDMLRRRPEGIRVPLEERYRKYVEEGFETESGRVEIYSELFLRHGYDPVPRYREPSESPSKEYPFVLTSANSGYFCHSQHHSIPSLRRRAAEPAADINPRVAREKGIGSGDWVQVRTRVGSVKLRARLNQDIDPRVIVCEYGWWQACSELGLPSYSLRHDGTGSSYNSVIADDARDPISGSIPLRSFAADLTPCDSASSWQGFIPFRVSNKVNETHDIISLSLAAMDGRVLPTYRPGQYITLKIHGLTRCFSLSDQPGINLFSYRITVKRLPDGAVSGPLFDEVRVGDVVELETPHGTFGLPLRSEFPVVLVAGGIGITPFMSLLESLRGRADEPSVTLFYGCRSSADHAFAARISELSTVLPNLKVSTFYSRPGREDTYDAFGRVTAADIPETLIEKRARFYLCGPEAMMDQVAGGLIDRGVFGFEIFRERFQSQLPARSANEDPHSVRFARSGREVTWTAKAGSILACAESAGVSLPSGCKVGQCESCAVPILSGEVFYASDLPGVEDGACLTCQAIPISDLVLNA